MPPAPTETGLFASLRGLLGTAVALLRTRLGLLAAEIEEEKLRLLGLLACGAAAFFFIGCAVVTMAAFLIALFWETHRLQAIGGVGLFFLGCGGIAVMQLRRLARRKSSLFAASLAELADDQAALQAGAVRPHEH